MPFDAHKNLAIATVATAPSPAASGTSLVVSAGEGARFPAAPFNATVWPATDLPTPATAEVVRVTARTTDTLTITRAQEATTARAIVAGDLIAATITAKTITDIESGTNFAQLAATGTLTLAGNLVLESAGGLNKVRLATNDGADTGRIAVCGGGDQGDHRGSYVSFFGNEAGGAGKIDLVAGDVAGGVINFNTQALTRGVIHRSGGFSWGGATDPGASTIGIPPGVGRFIKGDPNTTPGTDFVLMGFRQDQFSAGVAISTSGTALAYMQQFLNANGIVGVISTSGTATTYGTTSDERLKTDRGRPTDPDVLRRTVIHDFEWTADGTPGRGVFAQEAAAVAPFAVTVGADDVDDQGRLTKPWGVDYSKYVPDLIVGWQAHEAQVATLEAQVATLEARLAALEAALAARG